MLQSKSPAYCPVDLPADRGELHPKRLHHHSKVLHNRLEYNLYMHALGKSNPQQKAAAMEDFLAFYPHSQMKIDALEQAMAAYQASGDTAKVADTANRLLQAEPGNLRALAVLVFLARGCAARELASEKELSQLAQRGLAALPEWQEAQGDSLPEAAKLRDEMAAIFAGAAGWEALVNRDYAAARQFYEKALASDPKNLQDLYQLAITDLEMTPIDPNGFWYCGKAVSIVQLQHNNAAAGQMSAYCKFKLKKYGGNPEAWNQLVSNTEKDTAPPPDFAKNLSLQEPSQTLQQPNPTSGNAVPPPSSEKGDPISKRIPATEKGPPAGAGIGSSAAGDMAPTERQGHLPEVISLSNNSLSNSDFGSRYGWYIQNISHKVAFNWHAPTDPDPAGHRCTIAFMIQPDGSPSNIRVEKSSGFAVLDEASMQAVRGIDSFGPVPTHEKIAVEFWFDSRR